MTKEEILKETIEFYSVPGRRAVVMHNDIQNGCYYLSPEGNNCAVGRCMTKKAIDDLIEAERLQETIAMLSKDEFNLGIDHLLEERYHGHELRFWRLLQGLHDTQDCWDENGLTLTGRKQVNHMVNEFEMSQALYSKAAEFIDA
jgi:hypothetical protein